MTGSLWIDAHESVHDGLWHISLSPELIRDAEQQDEYRLRTRHTYAFYKWNQ